MITTRRYEAEIPVAKYVEKYVDIETFGQKCRECPTYCKFWSCPEFDFDVKEYWEKYNDLFLLAMKIKPDDKYRGKVFEGEELDRILKETLNKGKELLSGELAVWEKKMPGSIALSAGSCILCDEKCAREDGLPCRHPEDMRYSIESLGGNVGKTVSELMGLDLLWVEEGKIPEYFVLVSGLLYNPK